MRILLKPRFAVLVLMAAMSVWAFTVGPWGSLRERTAASSRLEVRGDTYKIQSVISPTFSLSGGPSTIRIVAAPGTGASPDGSSLIASVSWRLVPAGTCASPAALIHQGFMSPELDSGATDLADVMGSDPSGRYRMSLAAKSDTSATITATLVAQRGYWRGIPVWYFILLAGVVYMGIAVWWKRREYPPSTWLSPHAQRHETT